MNGNDSATTPARLEPGGRLLLGPGPSMVHRRVYEALGQPLVGHLDPRFLAIMDRLQTMLRDVFRTRNRLTMAVSGTGTAGMEACLVNLLEPGDEAIVCVNGVFGNRMAEMVGRVGARLRRLDRPWGEVFEPQEIGDALDRHPGARLVAIVHAETSTGAHQPLEEIAGLCRRRGPLLVVDAVTSLGGVPVEVDAWGIDACYSGTQKCLSCPPGLAPLTFGQRAVERLRSRDVPVASWYLDLSLIERYWSEGERVYHHTAPISMNYALHAALELVLQEGLPARWTRHQLHSRALHAGLETLGFSAFAQAGRRLPTLNAFRLPPGIEEGRLRGALLSQYDIEIGGGLGDLAGKIWRIGLMGESARRAHVTRLLGALEELLHRDGHLARLGEAREAALAAYAG